MLGGLSHQGTITLGFDGFAMIHCPACRKTFDLSATDAARATVACPRCGRIVVLGEARSSATTREPADPNTSPFLEPLPPNEGPTQVGVASQTLSLPPGKSVSVAILTGPRKGEAVTFDRPRLGFGRAGADEGMDVEIADPHLARRHAVVECHGARIVLRDLGSETGTFVGDERIGSQREIEDGVEFRLGDSTFLLLVRDR
jgi:ribosomal protein S27E